MTPAPSASPLSFSRRSVLGGTLAAMAAPALPGFQRRSPDVIIIGAGIAGLTAALALADQGAEVVVLEGRSRPGGRIATLDDLPGRPEAGTPVIPTGAKRAIGLTERFGIETIRAPSEPPLHRWRFAIGGEVFEATDWPGQDVNRLSPGERRVLPPFLLGHYENGLGKMFRERTNWTNAEERDISLASHLDRRGASAEARRLIGVDSPWGSSHEVSVLHIARQLHQRRLDPLEARLIPGGAQRFPEALAAALADRISYGRRVAMIEEGDREVIVRLTGGQLYSAPHVICTVPFAALRSVDLRADLSLPVAHLIASLPSAHVTQVHFVGFETIPDGTPYRLWTDDHRLGEVSLRNHDRKHIVATLRGRAADLADRRSEAAVLADAETALRRLVPGLPEFRARKVVSWQNDPFARGAWHLPGPGQMKHLAAAVTEPGRRLHFAGEHLGLSALGIEAALESAERAVARVRA